MTSGSHARRARRAAAAAAVLPAAAGTLLAQSAAHASAITSPAPPAQGSQAAPSAQDEIQAIRAAGIIASQAQAVSVWTVRPGDTLSAIGKATGIPWPQLWAANAARIRNPSEIYPGQRIRELAARVTPAEAAELAPPPAPAAPVSAPVRTEAAGPAAPHALAPVQTSGALQGYAESLVGPSQFGCLQELWNRESGWRVTAENPSGAYGIPQSLPGGKMASAGADWATNGYTQIRWGVGYIRGTYGTPCGAWSHEESKGWY